MTSAPKLKPCPTLQTARIVLAMQRFSCYVTLPEVHRAVCADLGDFVLAHYVRRVLGVLTSAGLVHELTGRGRGCGKAKQYCWTGPGDLQDQQEAAAKRASAPVATKECVQQIAEARTLPIVLEPVPPNCFEFHAVDPASIKWTGPGTFESLTPDAPAPPSPPARRGKWERKPLCTIEQAVAAVRTCNGNKKAASELLNVSEPTLYKYLKLSGVVFDRPAKRNRRSKKLRSEKQAALPTLPAPPAPRYSPPPPACVVKPATKPPRPAREQKPRIHAADMLAEMHVDALWLLYKSDTENEEVRNELITRYYYLVTHNASRIAEKLPDCAFNAEEFYAPGVHGLIDAMEGFDLDRGLKFPTYAVRRIIGEMKDELRKLDWVPRLVRHSQTKIAKLTQKLNAVPTAEQLAEEYDCDLAAAQRMLDEKLVKCGSYNQNETGEHDAGEFGANWKTGEQVTSIPDHKAIDPTRRLSDHDELRKLTKGLNQNERLIVILYYWEGQTMKEIGEQLLLSESRVSQMHSEIINRLRARFPDMRLAV